jgi:hypothetical protein
MKRFLGNPAGAAHCCSVAGSSPLPRTGMRSPALRLHTSAAAWQRPQNLIEKIVQKYTVRFNRLPCFQSFNLGLISILFDILKILIISI